MKKFTLKMLGIVFMSIVGLANANAQATIGRYVDGAFEEWGIENINPHDFSFAVKVTDVTLQGILDGSADRVIAFAGLRIGDDQYFEHPEFRLTKGNGEYVYYIDHYDLGDVPAAPQAAGATGHLHSQILVAGDDFWWDQSAAAGWDPGAHYFYLGTYQYPEASNEPVVIKLKQTDNAWSEIAVYSWGESPNYQAFGDWPGLVLTADENGWYSFEVPDRPEVHLILNNNGGGSQFDFLNSIDNNLSVSACYEITPSAETKFVEVACPTAGVEDLFVTPQEVIRIEYYNLQGIKLQAEPQEGLFIAVPYYKGNVRGEAVKILNRK